ncbi:hypothetical protein SAMN04489716_9176 [Actinoplanes derwentensis]|uniref:Uncharacterized protein n=1 Tax=Actinoplanes derwentensis TaxID=113562 RepID=A0A1H2DCA4_9ACTN|nr:hypothetical protein SAMN04489716_9176 [Actinoplanes derwentensis]
MRRPRWDPLSAARLGHRGVGCRASPPRLRTRRLPPSSDRMPASAVRLWPMPGHARCTLTQLGRCMRRLRPTVLTDAAQETASSSSGRPPLRRPPWVHQPTGGTTADNLGQPQPTSAPCHQPRSWIHRPRKDRPTQPRSPYGRSCHRGVVIIHIGGCCASTFCITDKETRHVEIRSLKPRTPCSTKIPDSEVDTEGRLKSCRVRAGREDRPGSRGKPYARTCKNACHAAANASMSVHAKGQLRWPFVLSG